MFHFPEGVRWIPKGMTVEYLALAKTDLRGVCNIDLEALKNWDFTKIFLQKLMYLTHPVRLLCAVQSICIYPERRNRQ